MPKRTVFIISIATCLAAIVYFQSTAERSGQVVVEQGRESGIRVESAGTVDWDRELGARPDRGSLDALQEKLLGMSASDAVAEIESFLESGKDSDTGLAFEIGAGGSMKSSPTVRVFLLDLLLEIDRSEAARISRDLLASATTADEWAICLRNVARGEKDGENREFLLKKTKKLIMTSEWQEQPSVGYLNAFDVLVYTGATESSELLSSLIQNKERRDLAHAGFLTLDRLVQRETVEMLARMQVDRALQESRPEMTAQQFARADLRDREQRDLVKTWLLDPRRTPLELRNFAGSYPNNNQMISPNLLTSEERISGGDLAAHDREVLPIIKEWRADPTFRPLAEYLEIMETRLSHFVESAEESSR